MKKYIILFILLPLLFSCSDDDFNNNNRYLPDYRVNLDIDMTLPLYNNLRFASNPVIIRVDGQGINGLVVMNTGGGYVAYEASCPNQQLSDCSLLQLNGIMAVCPCDNVEYNLFTGLSSTPVEYSLKPYRVEILTPTAIRVYN